MGAVTTLAAGSAPALTQWAAIPSPPQGSWEVGPLTLHMYSLCILAGIVVALWWGSKRWVARGGQEGVVLDVAVWAIPFGIIGARLYHVLTDNHKYFGEGKNLIEVLYVWNGGLGIWGGVAGGALGALIACRRRGIPLAAFGDAVAPPILLAQAIGRLGNWFNQELYGDPTSVPWALELYWRVTDSGERGLTAGTSTGEIYQTVHPTFLYELLWNLVIVLLLVAVDRRWRIGHGRLFALYVAGYTLGRFFIELMRSDEATLILGLRVNTWVSGIVFLAAVAYFVLARRGRENPSELRAARAGELGDEEEGAAVGAAVGAAGGAAGGAAVGAEDGRRVGTEAAALTETGAPSVAAGDDHNKEVRGS